MQLKDKHIMVVDDDDDDRGFFCRTLSSINPKVGCVRATNGKEALEYLFKSGNSLPELIFLDINMPVMTGWELLAKLKKDARLRALPVIIFSTSSNPRDINIAYDLGALSYCVKPHDPDTLKDILEYINLNLDGNFNAALRSQNAGKYFQIPDHLKTS